MFWPMLIMYGGGALITLLFLRYVALADFFAQMRAIRRRERKPRYRIYPTVHRVGPYPPGPGIGAGALADDGDLSCLLCPTRPDWNRL